MQHKLNANIWTEIYNKLKYDENNKNDDGYLNSYNNIHLV